MEMALLLRNVRCLQLTAVLLVAVISACSGSPENGEQAPMPTSPPAPSPEPPATTQKRGYPVPPDIAVAVVCPAVDALKLVDVTEPPFAAVGNDEADAAPPIQKALDFAAADGKFQGILIPAGEYRLSKTLVVPSETAVVGQGQDTVLRPLDDSGDRVSPVFLLEGVTLASVRNLKIDGNARNLTQKSGHSGIFMSGANGCCIDNVSIVDLGKTEKEPSGAHIVLQATQPYLPDDARKRFDVPGVSSAGNVIVGCRFLDPEIKSRFGVRLFTSWHTNRTDEEFSALVTGNLVEMSEFDGFYWNAVEIAGPGTRQNKIVGNHFRNAIQTAVEADKAAKHNFFFKNVIEDISSGKRGVNVAAIRDQGIPEGALPKFPQPRFTEGNVYDGNVIRRIHGENNKTCAMLFRMSKGAVFTNNTIRDISSKTGRPAMVSFYDGVRDAAIMDNNFPGGLRRIYDRRETKD